MSIGIPTIGRKTCAQNSTQTPAIKNACLRSLSLNTYFGVRSLFQKVRTQIPEQQICIFILYHIYFNIMRTFCNQISQTSFSLYCVGWQYTEQKNQKSECWQSSFYNRSFFKINFGVLPLDSMPQINIVGFQYELMINAKLNRYRILNTPSSKELRVPNYSPLL